MTSDLSSARTSATGRQPRDIRVSNRYPHPRTYTRRPFNLCHKVRYEVVQQVVVWFDCFYPDTQGCCGSLYTIYKQKCLSCGVAPFSFKSTREDSIVVVSVMACHLLAWPPVGNNRRLADGILFHRSSVVSRYRSKKSNVILQKINASITRPRLGVRP